MTPSWIRIDQINMKFDILTDQISAVGNYTLLLTAKLLSFSLPKVPESLYTTNQNLLKLVFKNENCEFVSSNITSYLLFNQLSYFNLLFKDSEDDKISVKLNINSDINGFIQSNSHFNYTLILMSNASEMK